MRKSWLRLFEDDLQWLKPIIIKNYQEEEAKNIEKEEVMYIDDELLKFKPIIIKIAYLKHWKTEKNDDRFKV